MKMIMWVVPALSLCLFGAGCPKKATDNPEKAPAEDPAVVAKYERHMLATATCELTSHGISTRCKPHQAMLKAGVGPDNLSVKQRYALGLKHLRHARPIVRWQAADLAAGAYPSRPDALPALIAAVQAEQDPWVLGQLVTSLPVLKAHPEAGALLLKTLDHAHENVRERSVRRLARRWAKHVPGAVEKLIEKIEQDPSEKVRKAACINAGHTGAAAKLVPVYEKLDRKALEPRLFELCMGGLNNLWTSSSSADAPPSEAAYKLSLARLGETPRTSAWPTMHFVSDFDQVPRGEPAWYKRQEVAQALAELAIDNKAEVNARSAAVEALAKLKVAAQLKRVRAKLAGKTDADTKQIASSVDEALAKLK